MSETQSNLPVVRSSDPEVIKSTMQLALTKQQLSIQAIHNTEATLVYNEDNLESINDFIAKAKKAKKVIEDEHTRLKKPVLAEGNAIDKSKNALIDDINTSLSKAQKKHTELCESIEKRKKELQQEEERKASIKSGITANVLKFSTDIANCKDLKSLTDIESLINLEKTRKNKYGEFIDEAVEKFNSLNSQIKDQKEKIKKLVKLEKKMENADEDTKLELQEQKGQIEESIEESKIAVQEQAINEATAPTETTTAVQIFPDVKAKRSIWKFEVVDIKETAKKMPSWVTMEPVDAKIEEYLKAKKAEGIEKGVEEFLFAGVRFFLSKSFN